MSDHPPSSPEFWSDGDNASSSSDDDIGRDGDDADADADAVAGGLAILDDGEIMNDGEDLAEDFEEQGEAVDPAENVEAEGEAVGMSLAQAQEARLLRRAFAERTRAAVGVTGGAVQDNARQVGQQRTEFDGLVLRLLRQGDAAVIAPHEIPMLPAAFSAIRHLLAQRLRRRMQGVSLDAVFQFSIIANNRLEVLIPLVIESVFEGVRTYDAVFFHPCAELQMEQTSVDRLWLQLASSCFIAECALERVWRSRSVICSYTGPVSIGAELSKEIFISQQLSRVMRHVRHECRVGFNIQTVESANVQPAQMEVQVRASGSVCRLRRWKLLHTIAFSHLLYLSRNARLQAPPSLAFEVEISFAVAAARVAAAAAAREVEAARVAAATAATAATAAAAAAAAPAVEGEEEDDDDDGVDAANPDHPFSNNK